MLQWIKLCANIIFCNYFLYFINFFNGWNKPVSFFFQYNDTIVTKSRRNFWNNILLKNEFVNYSHSNSILIKIKWINYKWYFCFSITLKKKKKWNRKIFQKNRGNPRSRKLEKNFWNRAIYQRVERHCKLSALPTLYSKVIAQQNPRIL